MGKILIADDDAAVREMFARYLTHHGFPVVEASDGFQVLDIVNQGDVDVVLLDIRMPRMSGLDVLKILRQRWSPIHLPVIIITAMRDNADIVAALEDGANDYVTKPTDINVLLARLNTQLRLKRLTDAKDEFLRMVSHDMRGPLTIIKGNASLLRRSLGELSAQNRELLDNVDENAGRLHELVETFLDRQMAEPELTLNRQPLDFNELVRKGTALYTAYARQKRIELELYLQEGLPAVNGDAARLAQVVQNLVDNAVKFVPPGGDVAISTRHLDGHALLEVSDSGPGLTDADLRSVFKQEARLSARPTGGEASSGLGLAICKDIVEKHGGEIGVRNNDGVGATFWVSLPV